MTRAQSKRYFFKEIDSPVGRLKLVAHDTGLAAILWENENPRRVPLGEALPDDLENERLPFGRCSAPLSNFKLRKSGATAPGRFSTFPGALGALGLRQIAVFHAIIHVAVAHRAQGFVIQAHSAHGFA